MTSKQRKWQLKKQELGLCTICGKVAASHKEYCDMHYAAVLERTRKWYWEHGGRERKKQYNLSKKHAAEPRLQRTAALPLALMPLSQKVGHHIQRIGQAKWVKIQFNRIEKRENTLDSLTGMISRGKS